MHIGLLLIILGQTIAELRMIFAQLLGTYLDEVDLLVANGFVATCTLIFPVVVIVAILIEAQLAKQHVDAATTCSRLY